MRSSLRYLLIIIGSVRHYSTTLHAAYSTHPFRTEYLLMSVRRKNASTWAPLDTCLPGKAIHKADQSKHVCRFHVYIACALYSLTGTLPPHCSFIRFERVTSMPHS